MVYLSTRLVQKLGHTNVFLELWAQLFQENLGTGHSTIKLEGPLISAVSDIAWGLCAVPQQLKAFSVHTELAQDFLMVCSGQSHFALTLIA